MLYIKLLKQVLTTQCDATQHKGQRRIVNPGFCTLDYDKTIFCVFLFQLLAVFVNLCSTTTEGTEDRAPCHFLVERGEHTEGV